MRIVGLLLVTAAAVSAATLDDATRQLSRDVFTELIETNFPTVRPSDDVLRPLQQVAAERWPGIPIIPNMETGASDEGVEFYYRFLKAVTR